MSPGAGGVGGRKYLIPIFCTYSKFFLGLSLIISGFSSKLSGYSDKGTLLLDLCNSHGHSGDADFTNGVQTLDGIGVATLDGSGVATLDGSGVATLDGRGVATLDGSGVAVFEKVGVTSLKGKGVPTFNLVGDVLFESVLKHNSASLIVFKLAADNFDSTLACLLLSEYLVLNDPEKLNGLLIFIINIFSFCCCN